MSFIKDFWDIGKDIATGGKKLRENRRAHLQEAQDNFREQARREVRTVEEAFQMEREAWRRQLELAQTEEERARINAALFRVSEEEAQYHRASREFALPPEIKERMDALANPTLKPVESAREPIALPPGNEEQAELFRIVRSDILN